MTEVISQIWFGILLAGIIGGITGWFLRGNGKKRLHELESSWQKRYQELMQEKANCQEKIEHLHVIRHERNALSNKLKQMHDTTKKHASLEARLSNLYQALEKKNQQHVEEKNNAGLLQKKIGKMQALMQEKNSMVQQITEKLAGLGVANKEKQEYVERLEHETSDLQQRLANSEKKVMANDSQIQQLMLETGSKDNEVDDRENEQSQINAEELEKSQNEIAELRSDLDNANMRIQSDQEKISRLVTELPTMAKQLYESKEEIERRDQEVEALQGILESRELNYQKIDKNLDEHRVSLLDASSKVEVLFDALDQERDKNQQINADNKLKDYRLSEYAEDAENKALEIHALYERLTSAEFDLVGAKNEGVSSVSANNLLTAHTDEVEQERQRLLKKCDVVESELDHYKSQLESKGQQLEVQKVVNLKLREELERIQAKEPDTFVKGNSTDGSDFVALDNSESPEPVKMSDEGEVNNSEVVAQSIYDEQNEEVKAEAVPDALEEGFETIEDSQIAKEERGLEKTTSLLSGAAVAVGASQIVGGDIDSNAQANNELPNAIGDSLEQAGQETRESDPNDDVHENIGEEKVAILGWYGNNDAPKMNLLSYGTGYSNVDDKQGRLSLEKLDGITASKLSKLKAYGINSISDLHEFAKITKGQRSALESKVKENEWKAWCSHADLMRIDGMNITECKMLNELGVFSVEELSKVGVSELKGKIHQLKRKQKIAAAIGPNTVSNWVDASKELVQASS